MSNIFRVLVGQIIIIFNIDVDGMWGMKMCNTEVRRYRISSMPGCTQSLAHQFDEDSILLDNFEFAIQLLSFDYNTRGKIFKK